MAKIYKCCICNKEIDYKPIRLLKQEYNVGNYKQYSQIAKYDFCNECYWALDDLLFKWKKIKERGVKI